MDHFKIRFLEEAADLIEDLEKILLEVENSGITKESIEQIFRIMHTIKGSSSMFGFESIKDFTHNLETIYDLIRNNQMAFSIDILDVTLQSIDHIRQLLEDDKLLKADNQKTNRDLTTKINSVIGNTENVVYSEQHIKQLEQNSQVLTYYILFQPKKDLLKKGNNPLYLLQDLQDCGESKVLWHMHSIPEFKNLIAQECHIYWEIFLSTTSSSDTIKDVFIFVEDQCDLTIKVLAKENLFLNPSFVSHINSIPPKQELVDLEEMMEIFQSTSENESKELNALEVSDKAGAGKDNGVTSIRVTSDKLDNLMNLVSELVTTQARLSLYANNHSSQSELYTIAENIEKISRQLRDNTFSICLIPIETMITRFHRLIRDLSKQLNKEILFISEGTETEIDKTIIDNLTDPLMHILRNCIDHGIEDADVRLANGKPKQGTILLRAYYSGTNVHIEIKDDGKGIDKIKIREKAISKGLISADTTLSEKEMYDLMFLPGFSTASQVTEVSGRGVGMDVVKRQITAVKGSVEIESTVNVGTTITILLPLTLSIIDGLLVCIHDTKYVIPLSVVEKCYEIESQLLVNSFDNMLTIEKELVPFLNLRMEFDIYTKSPDIQQLVVVKHGGKRIGITVDYVIGQYQAVLKPLGSLYKQQDIVSGATILGDGTIALVLDTNQIVKRFTSKNYQTMEINN